MKPGFVSKVLVGPFCRKDPNDFTMSPFGSGPAGQAGPTFEPKPNSLSVFVAVSPETNSRACHQQRCGRERPGLWNRLCQCAAAGHHAKAGSPFVVIGIAYKSRRAVVRQ